MKFIHAADIHLGAEPDKGKPWSKMRKKEIYQTFQDLIQEANEKEADFLFLCGDTFHRPPAIQDMRDLDYMLGKLHSTKTVIIAGNHDYVTEQSPFRTYEFHSDTYVLADRHMDHLYFEEEGTCVYGLSYWSREVKEDYDTDKGPADIDAIHILLAHGGDVSHMPMDFERLKWSGFDYIALGHIHKPQTIYEDLMAYPGSLEPIDLTETGRHGYLYGEITEEKQIISFVPFARRCYREADIMIYDTMSGQEIYDTIRTELIRMGEKDIFQLYLTGRIDPKISLDFSDLQDEFLITSIDTGQLAFGDYGQLLEANRDNLIGIVMRKLEDQPRALSYAMKALLSTTEQE